MSYDTATQVIATAAVECGLTPQADPYASTLDDQVQLRTMLNQCGRELAASYQWQQLIKSYTLDTGLVPAADGRYPLPADYSYFINSTGWNPSTIGLGLPLGGPLTRQQYSMLVATNLAVSTIYVSFNIADDTIEILPAPGAPNTILTFNYMSNAWVNVLGGGTYASFAANASDVILYEPVLISKMLAARYKQAKGLNAAASIEQFQNMYSIYTGVNTPAPILNLGTSNSFPFLNPWLNIPQGGFGA